MVELVAAMVLSTMFLAIMCSEAFFSLRSIAEAKEQADAASLASNISEVLQNEIAYAYSPSAINITSSGIAFSKSDMTNCVITTIPVDLSNGAGEEIINILQINGNNVFDAKFYKRCSLTLNFTKPEPGIIDAEIALVGYGRTDFKTNISIAVLNSAV